MKLGACHSKETQLCCTLMQTQVLALWMLACLPSVLKANMAQKLSSNATKANEIHRQPKFKMSLFFENTTSLSSMPPVVGNTLIGAGRCFGLLPASLCLFAAAGKLLSQFSWSSCHLLEKKGSSKDAYYAFTYVVLHCNPTQWKYLAQHFFLFCMCARAHLYLSSWGVAFVLLFG